MMMGADDWGLMENWDEWSDKPMPTDEELDAQEKKAVSRPRWAGKTTDYLQAELAATRAELAACQEALRAVEWVTDYTTEHERRKVESCAFCGQFKTFGHYPDCRRERALSGLRARELAALLAAVGEWVNESHNLDGVPVFMTAVEIDLVRAYRAAFPAPDGGA